MDREQTTEALKLHENLEYIGLRAQATSVGLLQLCAELVSAGVLGDEAIERIKDAIREDIMVSRKRMYDRTEFEAMLRERLDRVFRRPCGGGGHIGTADDMALAIGTAPGELAPGK